MSPIGNTYTESATAAFALCERGVWREAMEMIRGIPSDSERLLIEGCAAAFTQPERAKDLLSKALRALPVGEISEKAQAWLACCYWATGESKEARAIIDSITPSTDSARFVVGLNASIFETSKLQTSLAILAEVEPLIVSVPPLWKGKFFNQRGWLRRRLKEPDAAISDYTTARYWFEQAAAPEYMVATVSNNIAGVMIDQELYAEAHVEVDRAINILPETDAYYRAQFLDQKALIFIAEGRYLDAILVAGRSVGLLGDSENKEMLAESLITRARAFAGAGEYTKALNALEQACEIGDYLGSDKIILSATKQQRLVAERLGQVAHLRLVKTALSMSSDSLRGAARLVGCSVQTLDRFIKLHKIEYHPKVRKSIITKPHK